MYKLIVSKAIKLVSPVDNLRSIYRNIPDDFRRKVNPATSKGLITNIPTQLMGNRQTTATLVWSDGKGKVKVELDTFMLARELETGEERKDASGDIFNAYRNGDFSTVKIATLETFLTLSYFTACFCTGQLPTPYKLSGQSTIQAHMVKAFREVHKLSPSSMVITSRNGAQLNYTTEQIDQLQNIFNQHGENILASWDDRKAGKNKAGGEIAWI